MYTILHVRKKTSAAPKSHSTPGTSRNTNRTRTMTNNKISDIGNVLC